MLYRLWEIIQLFLPYGLILQIYKHKKAVPANIQTKSGRILKAIMITSKNGIIFTGKDYLANRGAYLKSRQKEINEANKRLSDEINSLSFVAREELFGSNTEEKEE